MKKFVKAIKSPNDPASPKLTNGNYYEVFKIVKSDKFRSGKAVVVFTDDEDVRGFDSSFFE